jgi:hypothetical protein
VPGRWHSIKQVGGRVLVGLRVCGGEYGETSGWVLAIKGVLRAQWRGGLTHTQLLKKGF